MAQDFELQEIDIDNLILDPTNCRISYRFELEGISNIDEDTIITCLAKYEHLDDMIDIIKNEGWTPENEPFVLQNGEKYIVKEGNQRVAALKQLKRDGHIVSKIENNKILVKVYRNLDILKPLIDKVHISGQGVFKWNPWSQAKSDWERGNRKKGAYLINFIIKNSIKDILENIECYTVLDEALSSQEARDTLEMQLTDQGFDYKKIGVKYAISVVKQLVKAYRSGKISTRKRKDVPKILAEIKDKITEEKRKDELTSLSNALPFSSQMEENFPYVDIEHQNGQDNISPLPRKYPESISSEQEFKEWIDALCLKYSTETRGSVSYLLLKDLKEMYKKPNIGLMLCRSSWEALLVEYFKEYSPKEKGKDSIEDKSKSICREYTDKIKDVFPGCTNILESAKKRIGVLNDIVHGKRYDNNPASLYSTLTDIYPFFSFLADVVNGNITKTD